MSSSIKGISRKQLRRYVAMREKFDRNAQVVASLSSLLACLRHSGDDRIEVDPVALGNVHQPADRAGGAEGTRGEAITGEWQGMGIRDAHPFFCDQARPSEPSLRLSGDSAGLTFESVATVR